MRTLIVATIVVSGMWSSAFAADVVRNSDVLVARTAAYQALPGTVLSIIVRPDGGGLDADPDVGAPAMVPADPATPAEMPER